MDEKKQPYIFGYGSLIEAESRMRTTPAACDAYPVIVHHIQRGWFARGSTHGMTTTYLGAIDHDGQCNGVIYAVTPEELAATNARETAGYTPTKLDPARIEMLDGRREPPGDSEFWVYLNKLTVDELRGQAPNESFPMVQSYVDICVNGCLEVDGRYPTIRPALGASFTEAFLKTTIFWGGPADHPDPVCWVNDRLYPRRPFIYVPNASRIDTALETAYPELYNRVELEPASWERRTPVPREVEAAPAALAITGPSAWERGG